MRNKFFAWRCLRLGLLGPAWLLAPACQQRRPAARPVVPAAQLQGTWLQAHEETRGDTLVYRPRSHRFPPARGRTGFAIGAFGRFTQYDIAPTDGLEGHPGSWTAEAPDRLRIHLSDGSQPDYTLEIISLEGNALRLRRR